MNKISTDQFNYHCPIKGRQPDLVSLQKEASPYHSGGRGADAPGKTGIISAPMEMYSAVCEINEARRSGDGETILDASVQLIAQPLSFMYSLGSLWNYLESALLFFSAIALNEALRIVAGVTGVLGATVCLIQGVYEGLHIKRLLSFRSKMNFNLIDQLENIQKLADISKEKLTPDLLYESIETIEAFVENKAHREEIKALMGEDKFAEFLELLQRGKQESFRGLRVGKVVTNVLSCALHKLDEDARRPLFRKKFEIINSYFEPSEKQIKIAKASSLGKSLSEEDLLSLIKERNFKRVAKRTQTWLAAEIRDSTYVIQEGLKSNDKETYALLGRILHLTAEQSSKTLLVHSIGLAALACSVVAFTLAFVPGTWVLAFIFVGAGVVMGLGRYVVSNGYLGSRGCKFRKINLIPLSLRSGWRSAKELYNDPSLIKKWIFSEKPIFVPQAAPAA